MSLYFRTIFAVCSLLLLAGCQAGDQPSSPESDSELALALEGSFCTDPVLLEHINRVFPPQRGFQVFAHLHCGLIQQYTLRGNERMANHVLALFLIETNKLAARNRLRDPDPSIEAAIADMALAFLSFLGHDVEADIPQEALESGEFIVGALQPGGAPLVAPSKHFAIGGTDGLRGPVSVVAWRIFPPGSGTGEALPCPPGITTGLDCYELFVNFEVEPQSNITGAGLVIGQCVISDTDINNQLFSASQGLLPDAPPPGGIVCDFDAEVARSLTGWRKYAWQALRPVAPLFEVTEAWAIKSPVGGRISAFSPVVNVDTDLGAEEPPPPGTDVVVFNDINVFDATALSNLNNVTMVQNLVGFTSGRPRDAGDEVWFDCRSTIDPGCNGFAGALQATIAGEGLSVVEVSNSEQQLTNIPAAVKVIFLWLPTTAYTVPEINALKQFAAQGGRVIYVGEHEGFYGPWFPVENSFLQSMGATLRNIGGFFDCGYVTLPGSSLRAHQITTGLSNLTIACSSAIQLGPGDFSLYFDTTQTVVLSGVATIDTDPIAEAVAEARVVRPAAVRQTHDPVGRPLQGD